MRSPSCASPVCSVLCPPPPAPARERMRGRRRACLRPRPRAPAVLPSGFLLVGFGLSILLLSVTSVVGLRTPGCFSLCSLSSVCLWLPGSGADSLEPGPGRGAPGPAVSHGARDRATEARSAPPPSPSRLRCGSQEGRPERSPDLHPGCQQSTSRDITGGQASERRGRALRLPICPRTELEVAPF